MRNKAHFVKKLCSLRNWDHESKEAQELYNLTVVELLISIKQESPELPKEEEEEERSLAQLVGCS
jgi:hypothetical protein